MNREIEVWADWRELRCPVLMGQLRSSLSRGKEVFSFTYDTDWLASGLAHPLDPDLRLFGGPQYPGGADRSNFGMFLDSSPDRWGRLLMQRREAAQARAEGRAASCVLRMIPTGAERGKMWRKQFASSRRFPRVCGFSIHCGNEGATKCGSA